MPRLKTLTIEGYRSIDDQIVIKFPEKSPLILIGENNAGKSNIIRALDILFGEFHPKYKETETHDHHGRDTSISVIIEGEVSAFKGKVGYSPPQGVMGFKYKSVAG
ncbi:MAG: hypothetical protein JWR05_2343, partial [Mucilaginibacter sp.]|nr:hypothetical protein [Mucilaginibacter sp.]